MAATLEAIQTLPPEIREKIYKQYLTIKLRQRSALGWDKVNAAIAEAPFCEHNEQIVKVLFCHKCRYCRRNGLCQTGGAAVAHAQLRSLFAREK